MGMHNKRGIHGACPSEMLHALLLGDFKYVRDMLFEQLGKDSIPAKEINALAKLFGQLFQRQSDRDVPKTKFSRGVKGGKLMAKEYSGVLLVLAAVLRSTAGLKVLREKAKKKYFGKDEFIKDWIMLLETMLEWEMWLKQENMKVSEVKRSKAKNRVVLKLIKAIGRRKTGMGLKLMKFHVVVHLADDILSFGVPMVVDTGSNESHHKKTKSAAKMTQKQPAVFVLQVANRLHEFLCLDLAMCEVAGKCLWDYLAPVSDTLSLAEETTEEQEEEATMDQEEVLPTVSNGGTRYCVYYPPTKEDDELSKPLYMMGYSPPKPNFPKKNLENDFVNFVGSTVLKHMNRVANWTKVELFSEHIRNGQMFRGNHDYRKKPWRDWVMINFGSYYGEVPCQIWSYVDLRDVPVEQLNFTVEGMKVKNPGIYAIVESTYPILEKDEITRSDIFKPIAKYTREDGSRQFYLVDVDSFAAPVLVVPDVGGKRNAFLRMTPRSVWLHRFMSWLMEPHALDKMDDNNEEEQKKQPGEHNKRKRVEPLEEEEPEEPAPEEVEEAPAHSAPKKRRKRRKPRH
jgi:hypothetical protein